MARRRRSYRAVRSLIAALVLLSVVIGSALVNAGFTFMDHLHGLPAIPGVAKTVVTNGADQWNGDQTITRPASTFSPPVSRVLVSPLFEDYYQSHNAALGSPLTVAFPSGQGWLQFFTSGALLLPISQPAATQQTDYLLASLVNKGVKDQATGIVRLPLVQALLTIGSQVPIGGENSSISYVDLRRAADPALMQSAPTINHALSRSTRGQRDIFIKGGTRAGNAVGHLIPPLFWHFLNLSSSSPDGWQQDFGVPLTEALPFTVSRNGTTHHMLVQVFAHDGLIVDQDARDATGQLQIQRLATGLDFLSTLGPPAVRLGKQRYLWPQGETALLAAPDTTQAIAHVGQNFKLALLGDSTWSGGTLWYHVQWSVPKSTTSGWVSAASVTFTSPGAVPEWASFDVLSPDLASYLAGLGSNTGAVVYDVTRQRYYTDNSSTPFIAASSMKVPIMLAFLDKMEDEKQTLDDNAISTLTLMIENSDNDSASELYYNEMNGADDVANYLQKIGVTGLQANSDAWGYSLITPQAMVDMLTLLYKGKILTPQDRTLALNLMENIESDQQVGVGDTAPSQAVVAMKDGWVSEDDNLWAMNTSGIVTINSETYIISVYTQEQQSLDDGQAIARKVCSAVSASLIS